MSGWSLALRAFLFSLSGAPDFPLRITVISIPSLELTHIPFLTQASIFHLPASPVAPVALSVDHGESGEQE